MMEDEDEVQAAIDHHSMVDDSSMSDDEVVAMSDVFSEHAQMLSMLSCDPSDMDIDMLDITGHQRSQNLLQTFRSDVSYLQSHFPDDAPMQLEVMLLVIDFMNLFRTTCEILFGYRYSFAEVCQMNTIDMVMGKLFKLITNMISDTCQCVQLICDPVSNRQNNKFTSELRRLCTRLNNHLRNVHSTCKVTFTVTLFPHLSKFERHCLKIGAGNAEHNKHCETCHAIASPADALIVKIIYDHVKNNNQGSVAVISFDKFRDHVMFFRSSSGHVNNQMSYYFKTRQSKLPAIYEKIVDVIWH